MDATLPPDSPDSASATPVRPVPPSTGGGSRIRSRPSTTVGMGPRLPGTYAANYGGDDMNWRRGIAWLWVFFILAALLEFIRVTCYLLSGFGGWPSLPDALRLILGTAAFLALWLGWGWPRWVLVVNDVLWGMWMVAWGFAEHQAVRATPGAEGVETHFSASTATAPQLALGIVYLVTASYAAYSADVVDFIRHRRAEGRGWVVAPVAVAGVLYLGLILTAEVPYLVWIGWQQRGVQLAGDDLMRLMSNRWDPEAVVPRADEYFLQNWPSEYRQQTFGSMAPFGALLRLEDATARAMPTVPDAANGTFLLEYRYDVGRAVFAHGHARVGMILTRHLFGHWQLDNMVISEIEPDPTPDPAPGGQP